MSTLSYAYPIKLDTVRRAWAAYTLNPQAQVRTLAAELGICPATVTAALRVLRKAGYVTRPRPRAEAVDVEVFFGYISS